AGRWWLRGSAATLLVLLCVPAVRRTGVRRRRLRGRADAPDGQIGPDGDTGPPGEMRIVVSPAVVIHEAHAAWDEFLDTLIDYGIPIDDAQTPRETARRI